MSRAVRATFADDGDGAGVEIGVGAASAQSATRFGPRLRAKSVMNLVLKNLVLKPAANLAANTETISAAMTALIAEDVVDRNRDSNVHRHRWFVRAATMITARRLDINR
jgi:hypothetical protein